MRFVTKYIPVVVGILFAYAGIHKLLSPMEAVMGLESVGLGYWPARYAVGLATIVELYLATLLVLRVDLRWGMAVAMGLMLAFTAYLTYLSTLATPPSCGCLGLAGAFGSTKSAALFGVVRNCLILWALKWAYDKLPAAERMAVAE